jgi:hypothetical protein
MILKETRLNAIYNLILCLIVIFFFPTIACPCDCFDMPIPCVAYQRAKVIFVGTTKEIQENDSLWHKVSFSIERTFKGQVEKTITISYVANCNYKFEVGKQYLIYADELGPRLGLGPCSIALKIEDTNKHIEYLTALKEGKESFLVQGMLVDPLKDFSQSKVIVSNGEKQFESKLEKQGWYSVIVDKAATYSVKLLIPFEINLADRKRRDIKVTTTPNLTTVEYSVTDGENQCDYRELWGIK